MERSDGRALPVEEATRLPIGRGQVTTMPVLPREHVMLTPRYPEPGRETVPVRPLAARAI